MGADVLSHLILVIFCTSDILALLELGVNISGEAERRVNQVGLGQLVLPVLTQPGDMCD